MLGMRQQGTLEEGLPTSRKREAGSPPTQGRIAARKQLVHSRVRKRRPLKQKRALGSKEEL